MLRVDLEPPVLVIRSNVDRLDGLTERFEVVLCTTGLRLADADDRRLLDVDDDARAAIFGCVGWVEVARDR